MGIIKQEEYVISDKQLILRTVKVEDAEEMIRNLKKFNEETNFLLREPDEINLSIEQEEDILKSIIDSDINTLIAAEYDGVIVGTCGINGNEKRRVRHIATLGIAIEKDYWGLGIGRRLIESGISWCRECGITRLELGVDTDNHRAMSLYLKLGFEVEGTHRNDKRLSDGSYKSSYSMALLL